ncbi:uncharacterized protein LOC122016120 [Zingiber officinale]|uniref:Uncharacterized protein n=1 Tax=Zingiber officinale TaxID=94328 RepID=A0A8J5FF19_ZINOF|nr:uncharacterized protein LOC122016120 [Zingiber officinale]XP_042429248.1 uncharacterized protein LOC122016120 [Zingiber officinale]KAG6482705.1 hypothetical protein ZIOFF_059342 [Zingiber officinale]
MDRRKTHDWETHGQSNDIDENTPVEKVRGPNVFERAKEEIEAIIEAVHPKKISDLEPQEQEVADNHKTHHKETHGTSNDIDENTPIDDVKGPNVFERAKEEIEAIVEAIHHKKESGK